MIRLPATPGECLDRPAALAETFAFIRALSSLEMVVRTRQGVQRWPLRITGDSAEIAAPAGFDLGQAVSENLNPETILWRDAAISAGGTFTTESISLADALICALRVTPYSSKILYLLPFLGNNLATARVPLRDSLGIGIATNIGFVDADFSEATGLQGDGSSKVLDSKVKPSQLGTGGNGGIGWWETNYAASPSTTGGMISYLDMTDANPSNQEYYYLGSDGTNREFSWNKNIVGRFATSSVPVGNGHFYGQRVSSTLRELYADGASIATNTVADTLTSTAGGTFYLMGANRVGNVTGYHNSAAAVAYMTDGTLTSAEVASLHTLLQTYLITPTGR